MKKHKEKQKEENKPAQVNVLVSFSQIVRVGIPIAVPADPFRMATIEANKTNKT
jgi:hypothetical protein